MSEGEGSSSVVADRPYSKAAYVEELAIPHYMTLDEKTPAVQQIRTLYDVKDWRFTRWHLALFYFLKRGFGDPEAAREYGDAAELFGTLCTYYSALSHVRS
ncbi:hypothetical protein ISF_09285 [Cordyceps fumosorosea ARSEF 2679]|uniref:Uncharacterized protein n=1 Tax=Cordyceps fumosorosea (strain ARSEF 2679) TaxID=1081104 RepID=A0A167KS95_CORFA|nr:hypothetical protein ISF_09285 [Cordyceps fumosorosea ARSEF 2679]OAA52121.1 hypothetical protein ISF_09285 [Cordyceps fumosorosea ARSEF 2679]